MAWPWVRLSAFLSLTFAIWKMGFILPWLVDCCSRKSVTPAVGTQEVALKRGGCCRCSGGWWSCVLHRGFLWTEPVSRGQLPSRRPQGLGLFPCQGSLSPLVPRVLCLHLFHRGRGVVCTRYHFSEVMVQYSAARVK